MEGRFGDQLESPPWAELPYQEVDFEERAGGRGRRSQIRGRSLFGKVDSERDLIRGQSGEVVRGSTGGPSLGGITLTGGRFRGAGWRRGAVGARFEADSYWEKSICKGV